MADEKPAEAAASAPASGGGGGGKLVPLLTIVNLVVTLALAGVLVVSFKNSKTQPTVDDIAAHEGEGEGHGEGHGEGAKAEGHGGGGEHGGGHGEGDKKGAAHTVTFGKMVQL